MSASLSMPTFLALDHDRLLDVDLVSAFHQVAGDASSPIVVEALCPRGTVLARTVVESADGREAAADAVLAGTRLSRCAEFTVEPLSKRKRINAMVTLDVSGRVGDFEARLAAAERTVG